VRMPLEMIYAFLSVFIVSAFSLIGVLTISFSQKYLGEIVFFLVALAVGAFLGDAFIHLIPEAFEEIQNPVSVSLLIILGMLSFFVLEKILHWHHHAHTHDPCSRKEKVEQIKPLGKMILISDGVHNLIDGIIIGISYLAGIQVGIATTIAVLLHEVPQEMGDFGILVRSGYTKKKALFYNFITALLAVVGLVFVLVAQEFAEKISIIVIPVVAGIFIYIASSDLVPELHKEKISVKTLFEILAIIAGIGIMYLLLFLEV
jgi:zinc and cadmium transporter